MKFHLWRSMARQATYPSFALLGTCLVSHVALCQVPLPRASTSTQDFAAESDFQNVTLYDIDQSVSVALRLHPEYDQIGLRSGSYQFLPSFGLGLGYDDNVYSAPIGQRRSDTFYVIQPGATISSQTESSSAYLNGNLTLKRHFTFDSADESAWRIASGGHIDISRQFTIDGELSDGRRYEESGSIGTPLDASEPIAVTDPAGYVRATFTGARTRNILTFQVGRFSYDDVRSFSGALLDESYRDQTIYRTQQKAEFALSPNLAILEAATYTKSNYDSLIALEDKDSHESRILLGVNFNLTNLIRSEFAVGYLSRQFDNPTFQPIRGAAALLKLDYFFTQLTTISLWARRAIDDAALIGVNAYFSNSANLQVDHELLRNLILSNIVSYQFDKYPALGGSDRYMNETFRAKYSVNNFLHVNFEMNHTERTAKTLSFEPNYGATRMLLTFNFLL